MNNKVINVLSRRVYQDCHIVDTVSVPFDKLKDYVKQFPKDAELVVYCAHSECPLSKNAWHLLHDLGYTNVYAYEGGTAQWYQEGLPVEGACILDYLKENHAAHAESTNGTDHVKTISAQDLRKRLNGAH